MFLMWIFMLFAASSALPASLVLCPDPEASDQHTSHMIDCLGQRFTWIHAVFHNFPSLLNFVWKLRCVSGICPRDLEDYGCSCRYVAVGNPVDPLDICCETHRLCYQNAAPCRLEVPQPSYNFPCSAVNTSCDAADLCQRRFCECDQAAIDCMTQSPYDLTLRGLSEASCSAANQTGPFHMACSGPDPSTFDHKFCPCECKQAVPGRGTGGPGWEVVHPCSGTDQCFVNTTRLCRT